jgi:hypothetical protein
MASRLRFLVAVALGLICISYAITFWPNTPPKSERATRALAAIGGRCRKNDDGNIISVTLYGVTDNTFVTCLQPIRRDLESLTFSGVTLEQKETLERMGPFPRLIELSFLDCSFNVTFTVDSFPVVQSLVIANSTILDASLAELLSSRLRFLKISRSNISAESLEAIARIKSLRELLLSRNVGLTDRGVASLARLPELRKLYLHRSNITGSGFAEFPSDSKLEVLYVYRTGFDSIGCKYVSRFKELRFLAAGSTNVSDTGILHLSKLQKLERLTIPISAASEKSTQVLDAMPNLKTLVLELPETSAPDIQRLNADWLPEWEREIVANAVMLTRGKRSVDDDPSSTNTVMSTNDHKMRYQVIPRAFDTCRPA